MSRNIFCMKSYSLISNGYRQVSGLSSRFCHDPIPVAASILELNFVRSGSGTPPNFRSHAKKIKTVFASASQDQQRTDYQLATRSLHRVEFRSRVSHVLQRIHLESFDVRWHLSRCYHLDYSLEEK